MKATALALDMIIDDLRGSRSWCFYFMKRSNLYIPIQTTISEQLPKYYKEKMATFPAYCKNKITENKIRPEHITNIDEVPLTFDIPVNCTVEIRTTGNESSFTVVLGCHANGQKLPPIVTFKLPAGIIIKANTKGWMDEEKMSEWLREISRDQVAFSTKICLYCECAHLTDAAKNQVKKTNSELAIILVDKLKNSSR